MANDFMRLVAFFTAVIAVLFAGWSYRLGQPAPALLFMTGAVALTIVTTLLVQRRAI